MVPFWSSFFSFLSQFLRGTWLAHTMGRWHEVYFASFDLFQCSSLCIFNFQQNLLLNNVSANDNLIIIHLSFDDRVQLVNELCVRIPYCIYISSKIERTEKAKNAQNRTEWINTVRTVSGRERESRWIKSNVNTYFNVGRIADVYMNNLFFFFFWFFGFLLLCYFGFV